MSKKKIITTAVALVVAGVFELCVPTPEGPWSLHVFSWYLGVAIWFSLTVPMRSGPTVDTMKEAGPLTRVVVGLLWPINVIVMLAAYLARRGY